MTKGRRAFRDALGRFATGVTVVTGWKAGGIDGERVLVAVALSAAGPDLPGPLDLGAGVFPRWTLVHGQHPERGAAGRCGSLRRRRRRPVRWIDLRDVGQRLSDSA